MCNIDHEAASPYTIHTAVLPKLSLIDANINSAITAMLDIVQPKNDDVDEDETYDDVFPHEKYAQSQPIIPVSCELNEPIVEWTDNKTLLTGAFPDKFLFCQLNKIGNIFLSIMMVNLMILYSSLMVSINCSVHVAFVTWLESAAKNLATLKSLGALANSEEFRRQLIWARDHLHSQEAKSLNAKVS
jgi:hypothetical protein